jgi:RNA polymerase sigma-70 factor, ECF subfamily
MAMTISIDDRQLVESYQAGDTDAFAELVRGHGPSLLGHAIRKLGDRAAAEDAVQETFVRAYRALPRFDGDYRLGPWLHRILANVCADEGNRRRREAEKFDRFAADPFAADLAPGVEDELGLDLDDTELATVLESLPPSYLQVLNLRFVQELPYDEVARVAGVSEENARARVSRARSAARSALRGVAAIPALLVPALRRSETVAAAATHSDNVRLATEAAVASAPAATPVITKAVIGISVVAAMAASPTSAPMQADQSRAIVVAAAPSVVDDGPSFAVASPVVVTPSATQSSGSDGVEVVEPSTQPVAPAPEPEPTEGSGSASSEAVPLPSNGSAGTPTADPDDEAPVDPAPLVRSGGTATFSELTLTAAGPRLDLVGKASVVVGDRTFDGTVAGRLSHTDQVDVRRYTATLVVTLADGSVIDLRLQLQGRAVADQAGVPLTEVTVFELAGPFRATSDASVALLESGNAVGTLDLDAGALSFRFS